MRASYDARMVLALSLHVLLAFQPTPLLSPVARQGAVEEAARLWARYHVIVDLADGVSVPLSPDVTLVRVDLASLPRLENGSSRALALIPFYEGSPAAAIGVNYGGLLQLVRGLSMLGRREWQWPPPFRDRIVGRALGRVLAHEIGHFLLASKRHSNRGLMRADHRINELVQAEDDLYRLDRVDSERLRAAGTAVAVARGVR